MGFTSSNCVLNPFKIAGMLHWKLFAARSFNVLNSSYDHFGCYESVFYNIYRLYKIVKYLYHPEKTFLSPILWSLFESIPILFNRCFRRTFMRFQPVGLVEVLLVGAQFLVEHSISFLTFQAGNDSDQHFHLVFQQNNWTKCYMQSKQL